MVFCCVLVVSGQFLYVHGNNHIVCITYCQDHLYVTIHQYLADMLTE